MECKLDEVCDFINGGAWNESEYVEDGIPVVKVSNLKGNNINSDGTCYIAPESLVKYQKNLLQKNDLIIATVGSHPSLESSAAGRSVITPGKNVGYLLNQNAVCIRTKDNNLLDQKYLGYVAKTQKFKNFIQVRGAGAANQMRIPIGAIKSFKIDIPKEQKKIAKILSNYDDLIGNNLERIKLLEESARLTYEEWFLRFRIDGEKLEIDSETRLPFGWEKKKAKEVLNINIGKTPPRGETQWFTENDKGVKWVSIKDMKQSSTYIFNSREEITLEGVDKYNMNLAKMGTVLLSFKLTVGEVRIVTEDMVTNEAIAHMNIKKDSILFEEYIFLYLRSFNFDTLGSTSSIGTAINSKIVKAMPFVIPTVNILNQFKDLVQPMFHEIKNLQTQNQLLKEARDILLPRLMTGMIDVDELEVAV